MNSECDSDRGSMPGKYVCQVAYPIRTAGINAEMLNLECPNTVGPFASWFSQISWQSLGVDVTLNVLQGKSFQDLSVYCLFAMKSRAPQDWLCTFFVPMRCVVLLEVMVKAQHVPRVFNDFFTLPHAKKPDPNSETSHLAAAVIELSVYIFRCIQCTTLLYLSKEVWMRNFRVTKF